RDDTDHEVRNMALLGVEYTLRSLRIDRPRQCRSIGGTRIQKLLQAPINEQNSRLVAHERPAGLLMECCKIVLGKRGRCRERLKSNGGTIELAIDVIHQALCDLQNSALGFLL